MTVDLASTHRADRNRLMHRLFDIMVILKGLDGILEIVGGTALMLIKSGAIVALVNTLTARELSEDPDDFFANLLRDWAAAFGQKAQEFAIVYLLFHGFAKVILATSLLMGKSWAYPVALAFFSIFVAYAGFRLYLGWSWPVAVIIALDLFTIALVAREWRIVRAARPLITSG
jgi:uncharacterized membrane protein